MASGHALAEHKRTGRRVRILGADGRPRWADVWEGLPWIVRPREETRSTTNIRNGPGCRPYVRYPFTVETGIRFSGWRARDHVGALALTEAERAFALKATKGLRPFVVLEPYLKRQSNPNKQWGWDNWQALANLLHGWELVQIGQKPAKRLKGVRYIVTPTFRHGAAVLERAKASVLPEGGLHHAAGVLRLPAIVLFGSCIDPQATGYEHHVNLTDDDPRSPCGTWKPCQHCQEAWARLKPETVAQALRDLLRRAA